LRSKSPTEAERIRVVSIDDEAALHTSLDTLIDWGSVGMAHAAAFTNPQTAIDYILAERPEIVIVDIRMPRVDGLQLIERVRGEAGYTPQFVILSGYREFAYAREALRLGVSGYLLKPIDATELHEMLERVGEECRSRAREPAGLPQVVRRTIEGLASPEDHARLEDVTSRVPVTGYRYVLVLPYGADAAPRMSGEDLSRSAEATALRDSRELVYRGDRGLFHWIVAEPAAFPESGEPDKSYEGVRRRIVEELGNEISMVVGPRVATLPNVVESREQTRTAMNRVYMLAEPRAIMAERHLFESARVVPTTLASELIDELIQGADHTVRARLAELLDSACDRTLDTESLRMFGLALITDVHRTLEELEASPIAAIVPTRRLVQNTESAPLPRIRLALDELIREATERIRRQIELGRAGLVQLAMRRLERHFDRPVSLKQVAEDYGVSPEHLGHLFRKFVGKGFKEHLRELRVREAQRLLMSTDLRVPEVAARVGYHDTDYFTDQFKRETGQTPSAWRRTGSNDGAS